MDRTHYPEYVQDWMEIVENEKSMGRDMSQLTEYCDKLYEYAQTENR